MRDLLALTIGGRKIEDPTKVSDTPFNDIITFFLNIAFIIGIAVALFFLIWGGIKWIVSRGEPERLEAARQTIIYAVVGLIVILLAAFAVKFIADLLGIPWLISFEGSGGGGGNAGGDQG